MVSKTFLIDYLKAQSEIYCECPFCKELFRLNEARLTFGKRAKKDLLDRIRSMREDFELKLLQEREDAKKRSRAVSKGLMLEHICPYLPSFAHHPRDARFLGDPIDFVVFNGLFPKREVTELTIAEVKSGGAQLNEVEKSIEKTIRKGRVNFEVIHLK
ncbi:MAG: Holliday junction resolvase-like protein [Candidatus Bathyarchaeia archaeon]